MPACAAWDEVGPHTTCMPGGQPGRRIEGRHGEVHRCMRVPVNLSLQQSHPTPAVCLLSRTYPVPLRHSSCHPVFSCRPSHAAQPPSPAPAHHGTLLLTPEALSRAGWGRAEERENEQGRMWGVQGKGKQKNGTQSKTGKMKCGRVAAAGICSTFTIGGSSS